MTSPTRIYLSMLIETDQAAADVQLAVLAALSDRYNIINTSVHGADNDDPMPLITFVVCPVRGLIETIVDDPDAAEAIAKREGAVTVAWTADNDHRGEVTA